MVAEGALRLGLVQLKRYTELADLLDFDAGLYGAWQLSVPVGPHAAQVSRFLKATEPNRRG
ncbi:hypothetical protein GCM10010232_49780 [Streptomyces amakusaensis]